MKPGRGVLLVIAVAACSEEPQLAPRAEPTGYSIRQVDQWLEEPLDYCRRADPAFLETLSERVKAELSPLARSTFAFEDFSVTAAGASGREAILRFRITQSDGETPMMIAAGPFEEEGCKVGSLRVAEGTSTLAFD